MSDTNKKGSSHVGIGMLIGAAIGVTTGLFLQSKKGKILIKDAEKKATKLQGKLVKELKNVQSMTKERYEEIVDKVTDYYVDAKDITKKEVPEVKKVLMKRWKDISKQVKEIGEGDDE